ncbi:MAG: hypothetical protein K2J48_05550 [Muribaculaceae bacterium]|nr:hypothetical protein [Muribaculaceae bacterium]
MGKIDFLPAGEGNMKFLTRLLEIEEGSTVSKHTLVFVTAFRIDNIIENLTFSSYSGESAATIYLNKLSLLKDKGNRYRIKELLL